MIITYPDYRFEDVFHCSATDLTKKMKWTYKLPL